MSDKDELGTGEEYGVPAGAEDTATQDRLAAEENARVATDNALATGAVIAELRGLINTAREYHAENHYVPRLRRLLRGSA